MWDIQLQRNSDGRTGDGHTSYPFSSWGRSPAEGWAGSWRRTEGLWDRGCGEANQGERQRKAKGVTFPKWFSCPESGLERGWRWGGRQQRQLEAGISKCGTWKALCWRRWREVQLAQGLQGDTVLLWSKLSKIGKLPSKEMLETSVVTRTKSQLCCRKCQFHKLQNSFHLLYLIIHDPSVEDPLCSRKHKIIMSPDPFSCHKRHCFVEYMIPLWPPHPQLPTQLQTCLGKISHETTEHGC